MTLTYRRAGKIVGVLALVYPLLAFGGLFSGAPDVEVMKVDFRDDGRGNCEHHVTGEGDHSKPNRRLKRSDRDVLVWRVTNECTEARNVAICPLSGHPFTCAGDPGTAGLTDPFVLDAASSGMKKVRAYVVCTVKRWPTGESEFPQFKLVEGPANTAIECPKGEEGVAAHEISIEVVP